MSKALTVTDPFKGTLLAEIPYASQSEVQTALTKAEKCFKNFRHSKSHERSQILKLAYTRLTQQRDKFVELLSKEAGKPVLFARIEVDRALNVLDWAANECLRFSGELLRTDTSASGRWGLGIHQKFPRGVVLGITPFNFPLNLVLHKVAPAIAAGCPIIIKPSPFTPLTALNMASLFEGAPEGLVQVLIADDASSAALTQAPEIATISFTGSDRVGWMIRKQSPEKPTCLELGGNAWCILSADIPESAWGAIAKKMTSGAFGYAGQSCISVQNIAVEASIYDGFKKHLLTALESCAFGDPSLEGVVCGPVISKSSAVRIRGALSQQKTVHESKNLQGGRSDLLITPTLVEAESLKQTPDNSPLTQEEIFGPVASIRKFESLDHVISQINHSKFGLQSGVYTQNYATIEKLYRELEVGGLIVNDIPSTRFDHQPYGGVKSSGVGREGIRYAMEELCESKFLSLSSQIV
jgi:acyl-CoA reductase-like NAD-dependent aldehyde dehydrogenase